MKRILLCYFILAFLMPGVSNAIPIPDSDYVNDTWLRFGSAPKSYDASTDIFSVSYSGGSDLINFAGAGSMDSVSLVASLTANVDEFGVLHGGIFNITGEMPSMGIPSGTSFLSGSIVAIETSAVPDGPDDTFFSVEFLLKIDLSLPELGFDTGYAVWHNHFSSKTGPPGTPTTLETLYTVDWGPLGDATYDHINEVTVVPEPASIALLGAGLIGLCFVCRKRLMLPERGLTHVT